jgi:hypothetical protein
VKSHWHLLILEHEFIGKLKYRYLRLSARLNLQGLEYDLPLMSMLNLRG